MKHAPKKSFGQHFLKDSAVIGRIVEVIKEQSKGMKMMVEVGPGLGALTEHLVQLPVQLALVEADRDFFEQLEERYPEAQLIKGDAASVDYDFFVELPWMLVGNLPYNAAAAIIRQVTECNNLPERMVIMVQKEQGDRMRAKPGDMSMLSLVCQLFFEVKLAFHVAPGSFSPPPKVDSSVLIFEKKTAVLEREFVQAIIALAKQGFSSRRKQLRKNIEKMVTQTGKEVKGCFEQAGLKETARAQELSLDDWMRLTKVIME